MRPLATMTGAQRALYSSAARLARSPATLSSLSTMIASAGARGSCTIQKLPAMLSNGTRTR